jgi:hypothetical protein
MRAASAPLAMGKFALRGLAQNMARISGRKHAPILFILAG